MTLGILAGTLGGLVLARRQRLDATESSRPKCRKRLAIGLIGLPLLYIALMVLSPENTSPLYSLSRWLRFAAIGLWVSFLVPKLASFRRPSDENLDAAAAR
jgi:hypothetical protein